jgi:hypothetical protein
VALISFNKFFKVVNMADSTINQQFNIFPEIKIFLIIFVLCFVAFFRPHLKAADQVGYYSWVRSFVIDNDLDIKNDFEHFGMGHSAVKLAGIYHAQPWAIGSALLWFPFFLCAHLFVISAATIGFSLHPDGYSLIYRVMVGLGTTIYAFIGLLLTYRLLRSYFDPFIAQLALIAVWLASPLVFYMYSHPMMAHANDMFAYAILLFTWVRTRDLHHPFAASLMLGGAAGLCALIRTQNALLAILVVYFLLLRIVQGKLAVKNGLITLTLFCLTWCIIFFPQLYVWHLTFGEWLPGNPYAKLGAGEFHFGVPYVVQVLFSTNRGLFLWNPLLFFGVMGLFLFRKYDKSLFWFLLASFLLQLAVIGSWGVWHGGNAFGQRFFVNLSPVFGFGLAAILKELAARVSLKTLACLCGAFIVWNFLLILQYALETIPRYGPVSLKELVINQFLIIPSHAKRILRAWITRS